MYKYEIAIVGGGPAGLSAAFAAARLGSRVILLEKEKGIGQFVRTSGVSWINEMKKLKIPESLYNPIKNFRFISPNNDITIKGDVHSSCVLDVRSLYQHLSLLAAKEGAEIWINSNVSDILHTGIDKKISGLVVNTNKEQVIVNSKLVIDATGFKSFIGRKMGDIRK